MLRFWAADRGLSLFLALLVAVVFVLPVFGRLGPLGSLAGDIAFSALLASGVAAGRATGAPPGCFRMLLAGTSAGGGRSLNTLRPSLSIHCH